MALHRDLAELRYGAAHGIVDIYSPWRFDGTRLGDSKARFEEFLIETIKRSSLHEGESGPSCEYRILATFLGSITDSCLELLITETVEKQRHKVRILLLDPISPMGSSRSLSLSGPTHDRSHAGLLRLYEEVVRATREPSPIADPAAASVRRLAEEINRLGGSQLQLKFHSEITSGISYFFRSLLIRGNTYAGRGAFDGVWDLIVNDRQKSEDRYDQHAKEFEEVWEHRSNDLPGERNGDPNGVFISYPRVLEGEARTLRGFLHKRHDDKGVIKELHVDLGPAYEEPSDPPFVDTESIGPGDQWKEEIRSSLNDKGTLLVLIPKGKPTAWMLMEIGHFWASSKTIIPVLFDPDGSRAAAAKQNGKLDLDGWPVISDSNVIYWDGKSKSKSIQKVCATILGKAHPKLQT